MYKIFYALLAIFWAMDILNMPFMDIFDDKYPLNTVFWLIVWIIIPSTSDRIKIKNDER